MYDFGSRRARRLPAMIAALASFLLGTNFCVLAGLGGDTRMACLSMAKDAASAAVTACHRAAHAKGSDSQRPAARPSCCPDPVVAPATPAPEKADAASSPVADAPLALIAASAWPAPGAWNGHRPAPDGQPPTRLARAPVLARAPPLA